MVLALLSATLGIPTGRGKKDSPGGAAANIAGKKFAAPGNNETPNE